MKTDIHPETFAVTAHCACGNEFATRTTKRDLRVAICSKCHPLFTGASKFVDTEGRIEKFKKKYKQA
jgi:large subunit ribosomal protein L31